MCQWKSRAALAFSLVAFPLVVAAQAGSLPAAQSANGVKFVSGGLGKSEAEAMFKEASRYPLNLVFYGGRDKHFVADVRVVVKDQAGKTVFETNAAAPILLVELPAGRYVVDAQYRGNSLRQDAQVTAKGATGVAFSWDRAD